MSPILGIWASSQQPALNASSFESIATTTVGAGGTSTITFSSIPSTYKHLQIRFISRTNRALTLDQVKVNFNSDTGANYYSNHYLLGDGGSATAGVDATTTYATIYRVPGDNATASVFGAHVLDILDYTSTNKNKTLRTLGGFDTNGVVSGYPGEMWFESALWKPSTIAAITSIDIAPISGTAFKQYSSFALYGIKG